MCESFKTLHIYFLDTALLVHTSALTCDKSISFNIELIENTTVALDIPIILYAELRHDNMASAIKDVLKHSLRVQQKK